MFDNACFNVWLENNDLNGFRMCERHCCLTWKESRVCLHPAPVVAGAEVGSAGEAALDGGDGGAAAGVQAFGDQPLHPLHVQEVVHQPVLTVHLTQDILLLSD